MKNTNTTKTTGKVKRTATAMLAAAMMMTTAATIAASADSSEAFAANKTSVTAAADQQKGTQAETVFKFDGTRYTSVDADALNRQIKSQYFDQTEMMKFVDNIREAGSGKKSIADHLREDGQTLPEESYTGFASHMDHRYILVDTKITTTKKYNRTEAAHHGVGFSAYYYDIYHYDVTETIKAIDIYDPECKEQDIVIRTYELEEDDDGGNPKTNNFRNHTVAFLTIKARAAAEKDNIKAKKPVKKSGVLEIKGPKQVFSDYLPKVTCSFVEKMQEEPGCAGGATGSW